MYYKVKLITHLFPYYMITFVDYIIAPIYLAIIYIILNRFRKSMTTPITKKYFFKAFNLKMIGALALGLVFFHYYGYGDTLLYHELGGYLYNGFWYNPSSWFHLVFKPIGTPFTEVDTSWWIAGNVFYQRGDAPTYMVIRIVGFLSVFCFHSYFVEAILFGLASFFGAWAMFSTLVEMYPRLHKQFATAIFYLPSVFFWGSGLMKDSLCFGALGLIFWSFHKGIIKLKNPPFYISLMVFGILVLYVIKIYILLCFIPALGLWAYLQYLNNIKSTFLKFFIGPILLSIAATFAIFAVVRLSQNTDYAFDNLATKTKITATYLQNMSQQGSVYYIGEFDGTLTGLLKYFPQAVAVSLFRPFLWEARNPLSLLSAFEATYFILFTLYILLKVKIKNIVRTFVKEPVVPATLAFAITFSFAVGINAGNFGTLVRYKIPMMPFYVAALMIILDSNRKKTVSEQSMELLKMRQLDGLNKEEEENDNNDGEISSVTSVS